MYIIKEWTNKRKLHAKNWTQWLLAWNRFELAEKGGIELPRPKLRQKKTRKTRSVEIFNSDGTTTTYPSINKAAKALGKHAMQLYTMAASSDVKFLS